ncbi:MAG: phosphatidate cytidylyltransferase [Pseudomonadota bacterium]
MSRELLLRLASASVLVPIGLAAVWYGGQALMLLAAVCAALMAFEWARMVESRVGPLIIGGTVVPNLLFLADPRWALIALVGAAALAAIVEYGKGERSSALLGTLYTGGMPLALQALRAQPEAGFALAMGIMLMSWASDTSAYFVGRQFGGPLLAPNDSPNKTWSGAIGGAVGSALAGGAFGMLIEGPVISWALVGVAASIFAQFGDLFESQLKRQYGVKDTSGFLPGHGGVMDRLDGFGTATLITLVIVRLVPSLSVHLTPGA